MRKSLTQLAFILLFGTSTSLVAQLPHGASAPNISVQDLNGNNFNLYSYTTSNRGGIVYFFATWCAPCWSYYNTEILKDIHADIGPGGSNKCGMIIMESDSRTNVDCIYDLPTCTYGSQGNYSIAPYQIAELSPSNGAGVASAYAVSYYPTMYVISHDNRAYELKTKSKSEIKSWIEESFYMTANPVVTHSNCGDDGSIMTNRTKGYGKVKYHWSNGAKTENLTGIGGGTYSVTIVDQNGYDLSYGPFVVNGPPGPIEIEEVGQMDVLCNGDASGSIEVNSRGGNSGVHTYTWSNGQNSKIAQGLRAGPHTVSVTDVAGCQKTLDFFITEPSKLNSSSLVTDEQCGQENGAMYVNAFGGTPPYRFDIGEGIVTESSFEGLKSGQYRVTIYDDHDCQTVETGTIKAIDGPSVNAGDDKTINCINTQVRLEGSGSVGDNYKYLWTTTDGKILGPDTNLTMNAAAPGEYVLHVTDIALECEVSDGVMVFDGRSYPSSEVQNEREVNCHESEIWLNARTDSNTTKMWTALTGKLLTSGNSDSVLVGSAGKYQLTVRDTFSQCETVDTVDVTENWTVPEVLLPEEIIQTCPLQKRLIQVDFEDSMKLYSTFWIFEGDTIGVDTSSIEVKDTGTIFLHTYDVNSGCHASDTVHITPHWNIPESDFNFQISVLTLTLVNQSKGDSLTFEWDFGDGNTSSEKSPQHTYGNPGEYVVCLTVINPCSLSIQCDTVRVDSIRRPLAIIHEEVEMPRCYGYGDGSIALSVQGGYPPYEVQWNSGDSSLTLQNLMAGHFEVTIVDQSMDTIIKSFWLEDPDSIFVEDLLISHATNGNNGEIALFMKGGVSPFQYLWSNGETSSQIKNLPPGDYLCDVTDAQDCTLKIGPYQVENLTNSTANHEIDWRVFPNPFRHQLCIHPEPSRSFLVHVTSITGKVVLSGYWDQKCIDLTELESGLYSLRLGIGQDWIYKTIVKL